MIPDPLIDALKQLSAALLDAYAVLDLEQQIVDFNRVFYGLFPRHVARRLKQARLDEILMLSVDGRPLDLAKECTDRMAPLRYDEIVGQIVEGERLHLIASAVPLLTAEQTQVGVFLCLRNVTDEAQVQTKYKTMLEQEARERELLQQRVRDAEAELALTKDALNATEELLRGHQKGLLV